MTSKEALEILNIAWSGRKDKEGYPNFDDINEALYTLEQGIIRLETFDYIANQNVELRKENNKLKEDRKDILKDFNDLEKVIEILKGKLELPLEDDFDVFNKDGIHLYRLRIKGLINEEEYDLLKEYF